MWGQGKSRSYPISAGLRSLDVLMKVMGCLEVFQEEKGQGGLPPSLLQCLPCPPSFSFSPSPLLSLSSPHLHHCSPQLCSAQPTLPGLGIKLHRSTFEGKSVLSQADTSASLCPQSSYRWCLVLVSFPVLPFPCRSRVALGWPTVSSTAGDTGVGLPSPCQTVRPTDY